MIDESTPINSSWAEQKMDAFVVHIFNLLKYRSTVIYTWRKLLHYIRMYVLFHLYKKRL